MPTTSSVRTVRGWTVLVLESDDLQVCVLPEKGGDVWSITRRRDGLDLLWKSPWGLREKGAMPVGSDTPARLIAAYPGGWQTVFPNGGNPSIEYGVEWGMHGEVWVSAFDWELDEGTVTMTTRLVLSPFRVVKTVTLDGDRVVVSERITNEGRDEVETMWSHHPAFGAPFLSEACVLETAATRVSVDPDRDTASADLALGASSTWPLVPGRSGGEVDLREIPAEGAGIDRMAYLHDFERGWVRLRNPELDAGVELEWDTAAFPHAWYWLEANGSAGWPWYRGVYVLGIEPATTTPGNGMVNARRLSPEQLVSFAPGQTREAALSLRFVGGR